MPSFADLSDVDIEKMSTSTTAETLAMSEDIRQLIIRKGYLPLATMFAGSHTLVTAAVGVASEYGERELTPELVEAAKAIVLAVVEETFDASVELIREALAGRDE